MLIPGIEALSDVSEIDGEDDWVEEETEKEGEDETESLKVMSGPSYMNAEYEIKRMFLSDLLLFLFILFLS